MRKNVASCLLALCALCFLNVGGAPRVWAAEPAAPTASVTLDEPMFQMDMAQFMEAWRLIKQDFVGDKKATNKDLFYGALKGLAKSTGDKHTVFLTPEEAKQYTEHLDTPSLVGVGILFKDDGGQPIIHETLPDSPAKRAGLVSGDVILAIDGQSTDKLPIADVVRLIRGEKGTIVKLTIKRDEWPEAKEISLARAAVVIPMFRWRIEEVRGKRLGVLSLYTFNDSALQQFQRMAGSLANSELDGLILDLRNNGGGKLNVACKIVGEWLGEQTCVLTRSKGDIETALPSDGQGRFAKLPTVILINGDSASASEILAGALQDSVQAKLVGEKSYGKGSVQILHGFRDGSLLKLTVSRWFTPKGRGINGIGLKPDIEVKLTPEDAKAGNDTQLKAAIELLAPLDSKAEKPAEPKQK